MICSDGSGCGVLVYQLIDPDLGPVFTKEPLDGTDLTCSFYFPGLDLLTANKFNSDQPRDSKGRWIPASMAKGTGRTPSAAGQSAMVHAALGKKADVSSHVEAINTLRSRGTDVTKEEIAAHVNRLGRHLNKAQVHDVARATGVEVARTKKDTLAAIHQHLQSSSQPAHEMTRLEFAKRAREQEAKAQGRRVPSTPTGLEADVARLWGAGHESMVKEALAQGKHVPAHVLAEYPHLTGSPVGATTPTPHEPHQALVNPEGSTFGEHDPQGPIHLEGSPLRFGDLIHIHEPGGKPQLAAVAHAHRDYSVSATGHSSGMRVTIRPSAKYASTFGRTSSEVSMGFVRRATPEDVKAWATSSGKPIPPDVIKDFPGLAAHQHLHDSSKGQAAAEGAARVAAVARERYYQEPVTTLHDLRTRLESLKDDVQFGRLTAAQGKEIHERLKAIGGHLASAPGEQVGKGATSADLATRVVEAAKGLPNTFGHARDPGSEKWMGHKVYVSDLYDHLKPTLGGMGLKDFKQKLLEAHLGGKLTLLRDDIGGTRSHEAGAKHGASEIQHLNATFHTVDAHGKSTAATPPAQPEPHQALAKAVGVTGEEAARHGAVKTEGGNGPGEWQTAYFKDKKSAAAYADGGIRSTQPSKSDNGLWVVRAQFRPSRVEEATPQHRTGLTSEDVAPEPHASLAKAVAGKQGFTGPFQRGPHTVVRHDDSGHTIEAEAGSHSGRFAVKDPSNVVHSRHDTAEAAVAAIHGVNRIGTSQGAVDKELRDRAAQTGKSATPDFHTLAATTHAANERLTDPRTGLSPVIPRLYEEVRKEHPGLTEAAFHEHLKELERHDLATQQVWDTSVPLEGVTGYPRERFPSGGRAGTFPIGWVAFHKDAGSRIKAAQAGKSTAR